MKRLGFIAALALLAGGCTSYYRINDTQSGKTYLTTSDSFRQVGSNQVATFKDEVSGYNVTLNSFESRKMSKDEYDADLAARQSRLPVSPK